jgi:hypothetical protein
MSELAEEIVLRELPEESRMMAGLALRTVDCGSAELGHGSA